MLTLTREYQSLERKLKQDSYAIPEQYINEDKGTLDREAQEVGNKSAWLILSFLSSFLQLSFLSLCLACLIFVFPTPHPSFAFVS